MSAGELIGNALTFLALIAALAGLSLEARIRFRIWIVAGGFQLFLIAMIAASAWWTVRFFLKDGLPTRGEIGQLLESILVFVAYMFWWGRATVKLLVGRQQQQPEGV